METPRQIDLIKMMSLCGARRVERRKFLGSQTVPQRSRADLTEVTAF